MPISLTVTADGELNLRKDLLDHLGVRPGDEVKVDLLPSGRLQVQAKSVKSISSLAGMLKRPGQPRLTIEEIGEAAAAGWAGQR